MWLANRKLAKVCYFPYVSLGLSLINNNNNRTTKWGLQLQNYKPSSVSYVQSIQEEVKLGDNNAYLLHVDAAYDARLLGHDVHFGMFHE